MRASVLLLVVSATAQAQTVIRDEEIVASDRPEAWAMHYVSAASFMTGFGATPELAAGEWLLAGELAGEFHVLQMDVDPAHARQGLGRALLRHALVQARVEGYRSAVLSTLSDVPWNAGFYASEGFAAVPEAEWGAGLQSVMAEEAALGFPMHLRVAMRRAW